MFVLDDENGRAAWCHPRVGPRTCENKLMGIRVTRDDSTSLSR